MTSKTDVSTMSKGELEKELAKLHEQLSEQVQGNGAKLEKATVDRFNEVSEAVDALSRFATSYVSAHQNTVPSPTAQPVPEQGPGQYVNPVHEAQANAQSAERHPDVSQGNPVALAKK